MDTSKLGNARQQDDNRIAVVDGKSLAECWQELSATFDQAELQSADYEPEQIAMYRAMRAEPDCADAQAWIKTCIMQDKATDTLREAFCYGKLPLWRIHDAREVLAAPTVLERSSVKYGVFTSHERPEPDRQGARLWVKRPDWEDFLARTVIPNPAELRLPPAEPFVTLSEALTWIAFGVAMGAELVRALLCLDSYDGRIPQEAIKNAVAQLTAKASGGKIAVRGKYRQNHLEEKRALLTAPIEAVKLADYRQYNYLYDELRHGEGLTWWHTAEGVEVLLQSGRPDSFVEVLVDRADLLREFPQGASSANIIVIPLPDGWGSADCAELPPWLNPYQLAAWVQYRDLSIVAKARDWNGLAAQHLYGKEPQIGTVADAERALQDGRLAAQGLKNGETFAAIPAVEWTRIRLAPSDLARQHPYLHIQVAQADVLSVFPSLGADPKSANVMPDARAPAVKAGRPPSDEQILAKADEMKSRGMNGRKIASHMRFEPGFEHVSTVELRELIKGRWRPTGRPKAKGA